MGLKVVELAGRTVRISAVWTDFVTTELAYNSLEFVGLPGTCLEACANGVYFQMC